MANHIKDDGTCVKAKTMAAGFLAKYLFVLIAGGVIHKHSEKRSGRKVYEQVKWV